MPAKDQAAMVAKLIRYTDNGEGDVVKLTDQPGYRLRHGNSRAVFELIDGIYVIKVAHRREVYR